MSEDKFPRLRLESLASKVEISSMKRLNIPIVPPRVENIGMLDRIPEVKNNPIWFVVMSPRENKGIAGPYTLPEMKNLYDHKEICDRTLCWSEGEKDWQQLMYHGVLRANMLTLPMLPPRITTYNEELNIFSPSIHLPPISSTEMIKPLPNLNASNYCYRCGNVAISHVLDVGETFPDLFKCLNPFGSTKNASEILPGFLWIGDSSSVKLQTIQSLEISLIINCTLNLVNPKPSPAQFKCRDAGIPEKPKKLLSAAEKSEIFASLEKSAAWIELERLNPEKNKRIDVEPTEIGVYNPAKRENRKLKALKQRRGMSSPVDNEKGGKTEETSISKSTPRVLLWSRLGSDRACLVAAAYLIKSYGMSVDKALEIISRQRPKMDISPQYLNLLDDWASTYGVGMMVCEDCVRLVEVVDEQQPAQLIAEGTFTMDPNEAQHSRDASLDNQYIQFERRVRGLLFPQHEESDRPLELVEKVPMGFSWHSGWSGLVDLQLEGRGLCDETLARLFEALSECHLLQQVRILRLARNKAQQRAVRALLAGLFPAGAAYSVGDYFLDDQLKIRDVNQDMNLTHLDISHNQYVVVHHHLLLLLCCGY